MEEWRDIPTFESYQVSDHGRVKGKKGQIMSPYRNKDGYMRYSMRRDGRRFDRLVHVLMAMAFLDHEQTKGLAVDHIDNDPLNNKLSNLQIITHRENLTKDRKNKTSKYVGVSWHKGSERWAAQIRYENEVCYLGSHKTDEKYLADLYQAALRRVEQGKHPKEK